jgi:type VI secretion system protein ImpL
MFRFAIAALLSSVLVWYGGPYLAFADVRPLESISARLLVIVVVVSLSWVLRQKRGQPASAVDPLLLAVEKQLRSARHQGGDVKSWRSRLERAVLARLQGASRHTRLRRLPWYVIIGAPGSGKRAAVSSSGLKFPLQIDGCRGAWRGIGRTGNCDWWLTNEGVLLVTSGRLAEGDVSFAGDAGWRGLLSLAEGRHNINGVVVTKSAQELMMQRGGKLRDHATATQSRLKELHETVGFGLPVYLMITKCDLIGGFAEFFANLSHEDRQRACGITFPDYDVKKGSSPGAFLQEFDKIIGQLNAHLHPVLESQSDAQRAARAFAFPQQLMALQIPLAEFVTVVFGGAWQATARPLLRGVYFTSAAQHGIPVDQLWGSGGVQTNRVADAKSSNVSTTAYFTRGVLSDLLLNETQFTKFNRLRRFRHLAQVVTSAASVLLAVVVAGAMWVSYSRNRAYVAEVETKIATLSATPSVSHATPLEGVLRRLDAVRDVSDHANLYRDAAPISMQWGLSRVASVGGAALDAYVRELDGALLPRVAARIRSRLIEYCTVPAKEYELHEYLKAYLMLGDARRLDKQHLKLIADIEWNSIAAATDGERLSRHFVALLGSSDSLRPLALDARTIAEARRTIAAVPIERWVLERLGREYASSSLRLDSATTTGEAVLRRKSGISLSEPLPALYTAPVFKKIVGGDLFDQYKGYISDSWVRGDDIPSAPPVTIIAPLVSAYESRYIEFWDDVLNDTVIVPTPTLARAKEVLAAVASSASPLRTLLVTVDEHTSLLPQGEPATERSTTRSLSGVLPRRPSGGQPPPGTAITNHFAAIHKLVNGDGRTAPVDAMLDRLRQLEQRLLGVGRVPIDRLTAAAIAELTESIEREAKAWPSPVAAWITGIAARARAFTLAELKNNRSER